MAYAIAKEQGVVVLPIGATQSAASRLAKIALGEPGNNLSQLDATEVDLLAALAVDEVDLIKLIPKIIALVTKLQGNKDNGN